MQNIVEEMLMRETIGGADTYGGFFPAICEDKSGEKSVCFLLASHDGKEKHISSVMSPQMAACIAGHLMKFAIEVGGDQESLYHIYETIRDEEDPETA